MLRFAVFVLVLAAASSCFGQILNVKDQFFPDKLIHKGKLISVYFSKKPPDSPTVLSLQFLVEEAVADFDGEADRVLNVATDIQLNPVQLLPDNYQSIVEAAIGHGIRMGSSCLVVSNWPGNRGKEMVSIDLATPEFEARIRQENRDYILRFERFNNTSAFLTGASRLGTLSAQVKERIRDIETENTTDADYRKQQLDALQHSVSGVVAEVSALEIQLNKRRDTLRSSISNSTTDAERQHLTTMLTDLDQVESQVIQKRDAIVQSLRAAGFESMMQK